MGKPNARDQNAFFNPFDSVSDNSWYKCEQENIIAQFKKIYLPSTEVT